MYQNVLWVIDGILFFFYFSYSFGSYQRSKTNFWAVNQFLQLGLVEASLFSFFFLNVPETFSEMN